jgi:anti-repressor protein
MDNSLQVFEFEGMKTRVADIGGDPWWVAKDVCGALNIGAEQIRRLDDDEKGLRFTQTPGGIQEMAVISESGLYALIVRSNKPEAKKFRRWITSEVLPAIRKHGAYMTPQKIEEILINPDTVINLAQALKKEQAKARELAAKTEAERPKVLFADSV